MAGVDDKDLGFDNILREMRLLGDLEIHTGVQANAGDENGESLVKIATIHEFGSRQWTITGKQAFFMARVLMGIDPAKEPGRFFGTVRSLRGRQMQIPERSFLRATFDREQAEFSVAAGRVLDQLIEGKPAKEAVRKFAMYLEAKFRQGFQHIAPPLSSATVAFRRNLPSNNSSHGGDKPLLNSGRLRASVRSVVAPRGSAQ